VANAQEVDQLLDFISQQSLTQFLQQKQQKLARATSSGVRTGKPRRKPP
jgi:cell division septum initiation protein DivIVA